MPTGVSVTGAVPNGNYSRNEMKQLKEQLYITLFKELEDIVAKHLNISGR